MSTLQSSYANIQPAGYPGMVADGSTSNRITRSLAIAALGFGKAVFRAATEDTCGDDEANPFLGISIATTGLGLLAGDNPDEYQQYDNVPILTMGTIFVTASVAVNDGDPVYVTGAGAFTNVDTGNTLLDGWVFDQTNAAAGLVRIAKR